jgi:hypothetical protein
MRALALFSDSTMNQCQKDRELMSLLFHLCIFHTLITRHRKLGSQGFNRTDIFNSSDLAICSQLLFLSLGQALPIPWLSLSSLVGHIMQDEHMSDDHDRHLCKTVLDSLDKEGFEGWNLFPGSRLRPGTQD